MNALVKSIGLILLGGVVGYFAHQSQPSGRFAWSNDSTYVLDTKTGQMCIPIELGRNNGADLPICTDLYEHSKPLARQPAPVQTVPAATEPVTLEASQVEEVKPPAESATFHDASQVEEMKSNAMVLLGGGFFGGFLWLVSWALTLAIAFLIWTQVSVWLLSLGRSFRRWFRSGAQIRQ